MARGKPAKKASPRPATAKRAPREGPTRALEAPAAGPVSRIESVESYLHELGRLPLKIRWFRGHRVESWELKPRLSREDALSTENSIRDLFEQNAPEHLPFRPESYFDWLFVMQHYGAPTRLLDWTENPLVALYFACIERKEAVAVTGPDGKPALEYRELDGAVWVLDPIELNRANQLFKNAEPYIPFARPGTADVDKSTADKLAHYDLKGLIERRSRTQVVPVGPLAVIGPRSTSRMRAQQGSFTVFDEDPKPLDQHGPADRSHLFRFVIPAAAKDQLRRELHAIGINDLVLFPSLEQVGKHAARLAKSAPKAPPGGA